MIAAVKKFRDAWGAPLLYGVVGGGVIFICLSLVSLSNQLMEKLERIGSEQTEAFEKLADQQELLLSQLADANPIRPYFAQSLAKIYKSSLGKIFLTVSVQNNKVPAEGVVSHLLVLKEALDANSGPLHSNREESANPIGPGGTHSHHWGPVNVPPNARPAFIVFQVRYTNALSGEMHSQILFLKFLGTSQDGIFIQELFNASSDEEIKIRRYMVKRGILAL